MSMSGLWRIVAKQGFICGFCEGFAESFNTAFLEQFNEMFIQDYTQEVLKFYTKTLTGKFIRSLKDYRDEDQLIRFDETDVIKIANACEKNGRMRLLKLMIDQKILTKEQAESFIDDDAMHGIPISDLQSRDVLLQELWDAGIISGQYATLFKQKKELESEIIPAP